METRQCDRTTGIVFSWWFQCCLPTSPLTASQGLPTRFRLSDGEKASRRAGVQRDEVALHMLGWTGVDWGGLFMYLLYVLLFGLLGCVARG
jgi:hypothetical protein